MSIQTYSGWKQNFIANYFKILFTLEYLVRNRLFFLFKRLCTFMLRNHRIASCPIIHVNVYIYIPLQIWHYYKNSLRKCVVHLMEILGATPIRMRLIQDQIHSVLLVFFLLTRHLFASYCSRFILSVLFEKTFVTRHLFVVFVIFVILLWIFLLNILQ